MPPTGMKSSGGRTLRCARCAPASSRSASARRPSHPWVRRRLSRARCPAVRHSPEPCPPLPSASSSWQPPRLRPRCAASASSRPTVPRALTCGPCRTSARWRSTTSSPSSPAWAWPMRRPRPPRERSVACSPRVDPLLPCSAWVWPPPREWGSRPRLSPSISRPSWPLRRASLHTRPLTTATTRRTPRSDSFPRWCSRRRSTRRAAATISSSKSRRRCWPSTR